MQLEPVSGRAHEPVFEGDLLYLRAHTGRLLRLEPPAAAGEPPRLVMGCNYEVIYDVMQLACSRMYSSGEPPRLVAAACSHAEAQRWEIGFY